MALRSLLLTSLLAIIATARPQATSTANTSPVSTPPSDPLFGLVTVPCGCWNECTLRKQSPETAGLDGDCLTYCGVYFPYSWIKLQDRTLQRVC